MNLSKLKELRVNSLTEEVKQPSNKPKSVYDDLSLALPAVVQLLVFIYTGIQ